MNKVYVLLGNTGEYSDHMEWIVRAYASKAEADAEQARLQAIADQANGKRWDEREAIVARLRQHDTDASIDYTGTSYFVAEVPFVGGGV